MPTRIIILISATALLLLGLLTLFRGTTNKQSNSPLTQSNSTHSTSPTRQSPTAGRHIHEPLAAQKQTSLNSGDVPDKSISQATNRQALQIILQKKGAYPTATALHDLSPSNEVDLVIAYQSETELTNLLGLTWALAAVGGDASARLLKETLTTRLFSAPLTSEEYKVMCDSVKALGFIAQRSSEAQSFLIEAMADDFWNTHRTWHVERKSTEDYTNRRFLGLAILALAISMNPQFPALLEQYKNSNPSEVRDISGAIVTAAFYHEYGKTHGGQALLDHAVSPIAMENYSAWTKTENGMNWRQWRNTVDATKFAEKK